MPEFYGVSKDNVALFRVTGRPSLSPRECRERGRINLDAPTNTARAATYRYAPEEEPRPDQTIRSEKQERRRA